MMINKEEEEEKKLPVKAVQPNVMDRQTVLRRYCLGNQL